MGESKIGITTARGMGPLPAILERMAGSRAIERVFSRVGIPLEVIENTDHAIPMSHMIALFHHAAREAGDPFFGLRVGMEMTPGAYGNWTRYSAEARTLKEAILRLKRTIWSQQTVGRMELEMSGANAVWSYIPPTSDKTLEKQHSDHVVPVMIRFAQVFLGSNWQPVVIRSCYEGDWDGDRPCGAVSCDWIKGREGVSLAIEKEKISAPRPFEVSAPLTSVDLLAEVAAARSGSGLAETRSLVATRLLAGQADIEGLAELCGLSKRTLQRRLDSYGTSYRQIVDQVRYRKAKAFLTETDTSVTDIALLLGYSDLAHFTRAFRRWSDGVPPSSVRHSTYLRGEGDC